MKGLGKERHLRAVLRTTALLVTTLLLASSVGTLQAVEQWDLPTRDDIAFVFDNDPPDYVDVSEVRGYESFTRTDPRRCRPRLAKGSTSGWRKMATTPGGANKLPQIAQMAAIEYPDAQTASAAYRNYLARWASCKRYRLWSKDSQEYEVLVRKKLKRISGSEARVRIVVRGYLLQSMWEWVEVRDRYVVVSSASNYRHIDRRGMKPAPWPDLWEAKTLASISFDRIEGL